MLLVGRKNTILLPLVHVLENQIQALSRTFRHRFKDFQGPCLFSRTFQALKIWKNYSRTFKDPQEPCYDVTPALLHRQTEQQKKSSEHMISSVHYVHLAEIINDCTFYRAQWCAPTWNWKNAPTTTRPESKQYIVFLAFSLGQITSHCRPDVALWAKVVHHWPSSWLNERQSQTVLICTTADLTNMHSIAAMTLERISQTPNKLINSRTQSASENNDNNFWPTGGQSLLAGLSGTSSSVICRHINDFVSGSKNTGDHA